MIKVMIVDDDPFIRQSLKLLLELDSELKVVGAAVMETGLELTPD